MFPSEVKKHLTLQLKNAIDSYGESFFGLDDIDSDDFELVEEDEWTQDYKYQYQSTIIKHVPTSTFWQINNSRSGSYHTDWYYGTPEFYQVTPHTKVITTVEWKVVKENE